MMKRCTILILIVAFMGLLTAQASASGCAANAKISKADHSCSSAARAACAVKGESCSKTCSSHKSKNTATSETLPNGHSVITVAEAQQCSKSTTVFLTVDKMHCGGCATKVTESLGSLDGVCAIDVSLKDASAVIVYHTETVSPENMIQTVSKAGYVASMKELSADQLKKLSNTKCANRDHKEGCSGSGKEDKKSNKI